LISADRYVEPPLVRELQVSALFRHKLIESVEENRDELFKMIFEEREIASKLWNDVRVGTDNFPELSTALQKYKEDIEDINNPIRLLWEVLGELLGFVRSNENFESTKGYARHCNVFTQHYFLRNSRNSPRTKDSNDSTAICPNAQDSGEKWVRSEKHQT
jgi:hypothetical protein